MDAATAIAIVVPIVSLVVTVGLAVRWGMTQADSAIASNKAQLEQAANGRESDRQRDAAVVAAAKAQGERDIANADIAKLHASIDQLIAAGQSALKEKVHAATGPDLVAATRAVFGVPQLPNVPAGAGPGSAPAGGGDAAAAAVRVPAVTGGG